jgi:hypothetical protein
MAHSEMSLFPLAGSTASARVEAFVPWAASADTVT